MPGELLWHHTVLVADIIHFLKEFGNNHEIFFWKTYITKAKAQILKKHLDIYYWLWRCVKLYILFRENHFEFYTIWQTKEKIRILLKNDQGKVLRDLKSWICVISKAILFHFCHVQCVPYNLTMNSQIIFCMHVDLNVHSRSWQFSFSWKVAKLCYKFHIILAFFTIFNIVAVPLNLMHVWALPVVLITTCIVGVESRKSSCFYFLWTITSWNSSNICISSL